MTGSSFIDGMEPDDRNLLLSLLSVRSCKRDEIIVAQDDSTRDMFFLLEGTARATIFSEEGKVVTYREIPAGAFFGELAAIDGAPRSASVIAVTGCRVGQLSNLRFRELVETNPRFSWLLLKFFAGQVRDMTQRVFEFSTMLVRQRLVAELLRICEKTGPDSGKVAISAPTHFEIATRISTHREAVSREMSRLAQGDVISKGPNGTLLVDLDRLKALRDP